MDPVLLRASLVVAGLVLLVLAARWWQGRAAQVRRTDGSEDGPALHDEHLDALGLDLTGAAAGAVLFGSPTCTPCDTVKRVLGELETERDGFRWVYADAAEHLDLTREHGVMRVPTLLVVGPSGRIVARTSGVPQPDELRQAIDEADARAA